MEKKYVYVLIEEGSWDNEPDHDIQVYRNFKDALKAFNLSVDIAKYNMESWIDDANSEQDVNPEEETASFEIYQDEFYDRFHDTIQIIKKEVI